MGHIVSQDGMRVVPKKIEAMKDWPCPKTLKKLQGFLGITRLLPKICRKIRTNCNPLNHPTQEEYLCMEQGSQAGLFNLKGSHVYYPSLSCAQISLRHLS
jgi:hypothetical protein